MAKFKIALPVQTYQTRNKDVSDQRLLNMYAEQMPENAKESVSLYNTPGLRPFLEVADAPIWGLHYMHPYLYAFCGNEVYRINETGDIVNIGNIGTIKGVVRSADNGTQILAVKPDGTGYIITENGVQYIADANFPVASDVTFNSQYFVVTQKETGRFYWSSLLDGTTWSALGYATQESNPDNVVGIMENRGDLWIFGDETTEIWSPSGNANLPFQRIGSGILNIGCKAKNSIAKDKNGIYWLGNDLQVHFAQGYASSRISTHDMEREFLEEYDFDDVEKAYAFTYTAGGHDFYVLTVPNAKTWVFDMATKVWHERKSANSPIWSAFCLANAFNKNIVGNATDGKLYVLDSRYFADGDEYIEREIIFPPVFADDNRLVMDKLYLDIRTAPSDNLSKNPQIMLMWSDDGGNIWSSEHWKELSKTGNYRARVIWRCLGQTRQRIYKMRITDAVKVEISGLYCEGEERYA